MELWAVAVVWVFPFTVGEETWQSKQAERTRENCEVNLVILRHEELRLSNGFERTERSRET